MNFFGSKKPSAKEAAKAAKRETKREVRASQRDLDREIRELERQEKQIVVDLKKRAKAPGVNPNSDSALKTLAKQLVQVRQQRDKMLTAKAHVGAVSMHANSMASQVAAASAIGSVSSAMATANKAIDAKQMSKVMMDFNRQNETLEVKQEMMNDALIDAFDNDEIEEEADNVTSQVLAELGVELDSKMGHVPVGKPQGANQLTEAEQDALDSALPDLRARLDAL